MRRWMMLTAGWALVGLGTVGLVLPVLQGTLFLVLGGIILSNESKWIRLRLRLLRRRYPQAGKRIESIIQATRRSHR